MPGPGPVPPATSPRGSRRRRRRSRRSASAACACTRSKWRAGETKRPACACTARPPPWPSGTEWSWRFPSHIRGTWPPRWSGRTGLVPPELASSLRAMERWLEPLHDAQTMRAVDSWAIDERGVPSLELMEAVGRAVAQAAEQAARPGPVRVVCGKGNNGGDGLVAARHLRDGGHEVDVLLLYPVNELSGDATANLERHDGAVAKFEPD